MTMRIPSLTTLKPMMRLPTNEVTFDFTKKRSSDCEQNKPKKKRCKASEELKSNAGLKLRGLAKAVPEDLVRKKKRAVRALSVTSMLRKFEREKERQNMEEAKRVTAVISAPKASLFPADAAGSGAPALTDPLLSLIGSTNDHALIQAANTVDFDIDLDSLLDASEETLSPESSIPTPAETSQTRVNSQTQSKITCDHEVQHQETKITSQLTPCLEAGQLLTEQSSGSAPCAPLPEGLPPALEENIGKLIEAARSSEGESKLKFFSPDINSVLLDIELQCQEQSGQLRSKVYTHLSSFLPCSRDTLLKRVRKLIKQLEEPVNAEEPMQKLKESIGRSMPEQVASFNESCRAYEETKTLKTAEEDNVEERAGRKGGPKKLFKWNEEIRECLSHVLKEKSDKYKKEGKGTKKLKSFLKPF
ncbi:hypothetical protein OJAV_G00003430 [Oryzias javanicus]|uniref:Ubinuclein middle domain-containing protein n=1 Tax=Oryzias javanicus TaxID=123683 RepID=A0A3S2PKG4_ORYJA|nr:hypothetical protein OJAV_G00003430 [Oryzias javanicus]